MSFRQREIVFSTKHAVMLHDHPVPDVDRDPVFSRIFEQARPFSMTSKEVMFSLYDSIRYVVTNGIPGDFVECGVWRGGCSLTAALTLRELGDTSRRLHLYDTYEGMTKPTEHDIDCEGGSAGEYIERFGDDGKWCYASLEDVRDTFYSHGFDENLVRFVKGDVLQTLKQDLPETISVLRLDTDWYESTKFELEQLYPNISRNGVLIIDDYGHWEGSRLAVDEYFSSRGSLLLNRISVGVRSAIKTA